MPGNARAVLLLAGTLLAGIPAVAQETKSVITLDEFMNATEVKEAKLSPDGSAAVIATVDSDWQHNRYRSDLWIWKAKTGATLPLYPIRTCTLSAMVSRWPVHRLPLRSGFA